VVDTGDSSDGIAEAPAWRRRVALTIDLVAAFAVFTLFVAPAVAVQGYVGSAASTLKAFGWVYLGVLAVLAVVRAIKRKRQRRYVTIGLSIMDIRPIRVDETVRMVRTLDAPHPGRDVPPRVAAMAGGLLIVLAAALLIYEVILYA
jgi:hypothetical protein